jgi:hypothetical protein
MEVWKEGLERLFWRWLLICTATKIRFILFPEKELRQDQCTYFPAAE